VGIKSANGWRYPTPRLFTCPTRAPLARRRVHALLGVFLQLELCKCFAAFPIRYDAFRYFKRIQKAISKLYGVLIIIRLVQMQIKFSHLQLIFWHRLKLIWKRCPL
jgi:hypothetical protein